MSDFLRGHLPYLGFSFSLPPLQLHSIAAPTGVQAPVLLQTLPPLQLDDNDLLETRPPPGGTSILTRPAPTRPPSVGWEDVVTWIGEAAALGAGFALVFAAEERPFQALGGGLIMAAGEGVLLEVIDRLIHGRFDNRWLCLGISLVAGALMGLGIQFGARLDRSGIGVDASDGRNPTSGWGP